LESPAQAELNKDDDKDVEVKEDKNDNEKDNEEAEEDKDNYQTIKFLTFLESHAQAKLNEDDDKDVDEDVVVKEVRMTMRTTRRMRRTKDKDNCQSVLPFWNHQLKPN
jgi:hypothetical protein